MAVPVCIALWGQGHVCATLGLQTGPRLGDTVGSSSRRAIGTPPSEQGVRPRDEPYLQV